MYAPTKKQIVVDRFWYWGGITVLVVVIILGLVAQVSLPAWLWTAAGTLYLLVGTRFALRFAYIRSYLGPLNKRDMSWARHWILTWPFMPAIVIHDDFPVMTSKAERALVMTKAGVTGALEQNAAASRWKLGDHTGHPRRPKENYM
jgi:hypothetical protein